MLPVLCFRLEDQRKKNSEKKQRLREACEAEQTQLDSEFNEKAKAEAEQRKKERSAKLEAQKQAEAEQKAEEADDEPSDNEPSDEKPTKETEILSFGLVGFFQVLLSGILAILVNYHRLILVVESMFLGCFYLLGLDKPVLGLVDDEVSISTVSPQLTPKVMESTAMATKGKREVPPISGAPLYSVDEEQTARVRPDYGSAGDSSDSPVEDWGELYSSDDVTRQPRPTHANQPPVQDDYDSEEERIPDPWNAICIVGIRVYCKDPGLERRTVMEGGEFLEGGMVEKGAADLDNAQSNAGGVRAG